MTDTIETHQGSTISLAVDFGIDLTAVTVSIADANRAILEAMAITVTDAAEGEVTLALTDEQADALPLGRLSAFRLKLTFSDGSEQTSNLIWINVS